MAELRPLTAIDTEQCMRLSEAEGWNQMDADWQLLISNPENVCLGVEDNNRVIATATLMNYGNQMGWVAMVLVDREYRGKGYARILLEHLFEKSICCRTIKLDATPAGEPVYRKMGFIAEYLIYRMIREPQNSNLFETGTIPEIFLAYPDLLDELVKFDAKIFGVSRNMLISHLLIRSPEQSFVYLKNGKVCGMATGRQGRQFYHCGPLLASSPEIAKDLITSAISRENSKPCVVDIPEYQEDLVFWLEQAGFIRQRHFIRMYRYHNPFPGIHENQFLICGPEFG